MLPDKRQEIKTNVPRTQPYLSAKSTLKDAVTSKKHTNKRPLKGVLGPLGRKNFQSYHRSA